MRSLFCSISEYFDAFAASPSDVSQTYIILHWIYTGDAPPFKNGFYNSSLA